MVAHLLVMDPARDVQRSVKAATPEISEKVQNIFLDDRRVKVREIFEAIGISYGTLIEILQEKLSMEKLSARWVPRLLTVENKSTRVIGLMAGLALSRRNPSEFLRRYITVDKTWIYSHTSETKEQSKQWTALGEPASKKAKTVKLTGNVMGTVFSDANGIIFIDYLEKVRTPVRLQ